MRIHRYANSGNHLHLLVVGKHRDGLANFLRTIGALIPRLVTGAKKGRPIGRFWDHLAFSRIVEWGRDFLKTRLYVIQNESEGAGVSFVAERRIRPKPG